MKKQKQKAMELANTREWTHKGETFKGIFLGYKKGTVTIKKTEDNKVFSGKMTDLSSTNQRWVRGELKRHVLERKAKKKANTSKRK